MYISLGKRDKVVPQRIIALINEAMPNDRVGIGRIDLMDNFSYVEVESGCVEDLMFAMADKFVRGRQIVFEPAEAKRKKSDARERKGNTKLKNKASFKEKDKRKSKRR